MRSFFTLICAFLLVGGLASDKILLDTEADEPVLEQLELAEWNETVPSNNVPLVEQSRFDLVCDTCKEIFDEVKQILVDTATVSEESLRDAINEVCDKIDVQFVSKVCKRIDDDLIQKLQELITKIDGKVVPENCCKTVDLC